ncbi:hypothetical protein GCM10023220_33790 [Streptomyces ziwulingensis]|uniref:Uncharacterized protein n=1 Tax=Streptomyces ziwulingensis TaxID=1045501 RepID=A0ABP9BXP8_9ACTN
MRSTTARESTRHTARSALAPGNWYQTIYHHTHPPPAKANRFPHRGGGHTEPRDGRHTDARDGDHTEPP